MLLAAGALCWLATVAGDAAHGVVMFPVLKRHSERSAVAYLAARIIDAVLIAVMALFIVAQIPLASAYLEAGAVDAPALQAISGVLAESKLYAYEFAMITVGVAGLILCSAFLRTGLIPRALALWGLAGYAIILSGSVLEIIGFDLKVIHAVPGGLWELFIGVWLIVKGFDPGAGATGSPVVTSSAPRATAPRAGQLTPPSVLPQARPPGRGRRGLR